MPKNMSGREATLLRTLRTRAFRAQGGLCWWCKMPMLDPPDVPETDPLRTSADHLIPLHAGGQTVPGNIVAAHRKCNAERHPELSSMGGGVVASSGDDAPRSPFAA